MVENHRPCSHITNQPSKFMNKFITYTIIMLCITALLTQVIKVYVSNTSSLDGIAASKIQSQIDRLSESNLALRDSVLSYTSYHTIASRAADLGLVSTKDIVSVYDPVKVAIGR